MPSLQKKQAHLEVASSFESPARTNGYFVQVPVELIKNPNLTPAALKLYLLLLSYCGSKSYAWPSQGRLAEEMGLSERRVRGLLKELEGAELVTVTHSSGTTNTYHLGRPSLKSQGVSESSEENLFRRGRKYISSNIHELELNHVCEKVPSQYDSTEDKNTPLVSTTETEPLAYTLPSIPSALLPSEAAEIEALLVSAGLSQLLSEELVLLIIGRKRDIEYVRLIVQASQKSGIYNPPGFIRFMLLRDADPVRVKELGSDARQRKRQVKTPAPIDFSKYTTGKYAYLTCSTTFGEDTNTSSPEFSEEIMGANPTETLSSEEFAAPFETAFEYKIENAPEDRTAFYITEDKPSSQELSDIWRILRIELDHSKCLPATVSQYARLKLDKDSEKCYLWFPDWVCLTPQQEKTIYKTLLEILQKRMFLHFLPGGFDQKIQLA
jgi:hypothetical protein